VLLTRYLGKFDRLDNARFRMCETLSLQALWDRYGITDWPVIREPCYRRRGVWVILLRFNPLQRGSEGSHAG
jgi:hypothetical protein